MKDKRWYEIEIDETGAKLAHVYSQPYKDQSPDVSIVKVSDLQFYRNNFILERLWGDTYR
jgi:hypothetical protein